MSWLPLYHDMGLIGAWFVPLFSGNPLVAMSPLAFLSRPERWLRAIHRHRGTISPAPNFAYELCIRKIPEKDLEGLDLSCWRAALNGAEPVHAGTMERFAARFAPYGFRREALLPVYGLAEASLGISVSSSGSGYRVDRIERDAFESSRRAIPAARLSDQNRARIRGRRKTASGRGGALRGLRRRRTLRNGSRGSSGSAVRRPRAATIAIQPQRARSCAKEAGSIQAITPISRTAKFILLAARRT